MKQDIDRLLAARNLDGFLVMGNGHGSAMRYLTGGGFFEGALVLKKRGGDTTLVHGLMERDNAEATGLALIGRDQHFNGYELLREFEGDRLSANAAYLARAMEMAGLRGRIGLYGLEDAGAALALVDRVREMTESIELVGEYGETVFSQAMETKDDGELAELQKAGVLACQVVGEVQEFIQSHRTRNEVVIRADGEPLTIGDVKNFTRNRLYTYGMAEDHGHIFAQGRDAGVPHNHGNVTMPLRLGQ
ncbi:MAG: hypothetical protein WBO46_14170 [Caldilineaceae bacterium]